MLSARLAVAGVGLPLLALLLLLPERPFSVLVTALLAAAAFELARVAVPDARLEVAVAAAAVAALLAAAARTLDAFEAWTLLPALMLLLAAVLARPHLASPPAAWWLAAVLYPAVPGAHFLLLRLLEDGRFWLVLLLAAVFATDTAAYAVGRLLGRHRMAPRISPGKTWEGAIGGLAGGALAVVVASLIRDEWPGTAAVVAIAFALPVAAQAGDLLESGIKRRLGVKDTSALLPGHGGLLDRLDSLLVAGPLLYWLVRWLAA